MFIQPFISAPPASGPVTRRKLISVSNSAATGMHSTSNLTMAAAEVTVSFWWRPTSNSTANGGKTMWAGHAGNYQIYTGAGAAANVVQMRARMDGSTAADQTTGCAFETWSFVAVHLGQNHNGALDVEIFVDGVSDGDTNSSGGSTEMTTAGTHYVAGDDASGSPTDDGIIGEWFDFCVFDGIIDLADLQFDTGNWTDLSATAKAALKYRLDGQNAGNPGADSSGNGNHFTVENTGVTLSDSGLPPGA